MACDSTERIDAELYPLDVDALQKGDDITEERCQEIIGEESGTDAFRFGMMRICGFIESESAADGRPLHVTCRKNTIHILLDEEDVDHQDRAGWAGYKRFVRSAVKMGQIDQGNLTALSSRRLEDEMCRRGAMISASRSAMKALPAPAEEASD